ncbi:MAG: hypothetical protein J6L81_04830 [Clostridia bacterium]|nr:hypothetical protein [Clostridia bacterium]
MKEFLERLKSPVVWVTALTSIYAYIEMGDFSSPRGIALVVVGCGIAIFGALNNPTDRDNM